jgi:uncharacterized membrane protein YczE/cytidylate kinase
MLKTNFLKRLVTFVTGLFIMAFGVALSVKADLGVSPISCIPYIYSVEYPLTMGETTIIFNVLLILMQIILLRKKYRLIQLVQLPVVLVFGFFTDLTLYLVSGITVSNYVWQIALCLLSCIVLGFGVFLEVKAKLTYLAGEGLALAISETFNVEFGKAKIGVDSSMVLGGVISSFALLHHLQGVREGTIVAALLVGYMAKLYGRRLSFVDFLLGNVVEETIQTGADSAREETQRKLVITISREFGSGGHEIGQLVAKKLGIPFYDKELIKLTAEKGGFTIDYIRQHEQKLAHSLLFSLYEQNYAYVNEQMPPLDALFLVQSKIIRDVSDHGSCVVVGRCADFVLKDQTGCFNVFVHAVDNYRHQRIIKDYGLKPALVRKEMEQTDHDRANYCRHYTGKEWGKATNYNLAVDSSAFGTEKTADLIVGAVGDLL